MANSPRKNSIPSDGSGGSTAANGQATGTSSNGSGTGSTAGSAAASTTVPWPALDAAAYHGLAGEVVAAVLPQTEADPVALLLQYHAYFGNAVGRGPHYLVENDKHFANLFLLLAGNTAKARKGLSAGRVRHVSRQPIPTGRANASAGA